VVEPFNTENESESVLSRWSRLKRGRTDENSSQSKTSDTSSSAHKNGVYANGANTPVSPERGSISPATSSPDSSGDDAKALELPSLESVSLEADFTPFMQAKVPEALKRQALKTLFKDAHFNTMDGLDTYIDDYTKFEPISAADLEGLSAWKSITNPLKQVVTPGGYAVDVESEEGKAVLAARTELEHEVANTAPLAGHGSEAHSMPSPAARERVSDRAGEGGNLGVPTSLNEISTEHAPSSASGTFSRAAGEGTHSRYGKRVGDFVPNTTSPSGELETIDDPR
jgi:hypothetical protein